MSKPTLSQIIELIKINSKSIGVVCDGAYEYVECGVAIEKFRELTYNTTSVGWIIHI